MSLYVDIKKKLGNFTLDVKIDTQSKSLGLFGLSGSGKSVTLKCIAGIIKPDSGKIVINDHVVYDSEKKINISAQQRGVGYLPQNYALFPNMTVAQNIESGFKRFDKHIRVSLLDDLLKRFELADKRGLYPHQLSGGQQQRVALARAISCNPSIMLLDEPYSSLDESLRQHLEIDMYQHLNNYDGDVVFVSHNRNEIYRLCNEVSFIENGLCRDCKETASVIKRPATYTEAVFAGVDNIISVDSIDSDWLSTFGGLSHDTLFVGFNSSDVSIVSTKTKMKARIISIIHDIDRFTLVVQINKTLDPITVSIDKIVGTILKVDDEVFLSIKDDKIFYLK